MSRQFGRPEKVMSTRDCVVGVQETLNAKRSAKAPAILDEFPQVPGECLGTECSTVRRSNVYAKELVGKMRDGSSSRLGMEVGWSDHILEGKKAPLPVLLHFSAILSIKGGRITIFGLVHLEKRGVFQFTLQIEAHTWHLAGKMLEKVEKSYMCKKRAVLMTSWTNSDLGRIFYGYGTGKCAFKIWEDPPICYRSKILIPKLKSRCDKIKMEIPELMLMVEFLSEKVKRMELREAQLEWRVNIYLYCLLVTVFCIILCWFGV
ncbi:hypothetical protein BUALT_Bualt12G0086200 [Buddleja alternifolia]|uniref:Uncharacterized protein n=1 Tax=Buddleja alternifolia TaxID=168488 RepID=A0AAV6WNP4_9LAMI|nr:hypothetical protein BUALT_Bualt12G0086200 [Buddleja alternifolia]